MNRGLIGALCLSVAVALIAGCGGSPPPISSPGATAQTSAVAQHAAHRKSSLLPSTADQDLLYVATNAAGYGKVDIYSYPAGVFMASVDNVTEPVGECVDPAGDVFVVSYANASLSSSTIYEYRHGGTAPVATFTDPGVGLGCAIDKNSGRLAVGNLTDQTNPYGPGYGDVAVYSQGQNTPKMYYRSSYSSFGFCDYDNKGNLYLEGWIYSSQKAGLARLKKGTDSIDSLNLSAPLYNEPTVQWDGQAMTVASTKSNVGGHYLYVYRLSISKNNLTVIGTTRLKALKHHGIYGQTFIYDGAIIGSDNSSVYGNVSFWRYPEGGTPTFTIEKVTDIRKAVPFGVALSPTQSPAGRNGYFRR